MIWQLQAEQSGYIYLKEMIFSPDGHCRPFDASAKGTVPGNGVGIVVLKKLESAIIDKDHMYTAVIRDYAIKMAGIDPVTIKLLKHIDRNCSL